MYFKIPCKPLPRSRCETLQFQNSCNFFTDILSFEFYHWQRVLLVALAQGLNGKKTFWKTSLSTRDYALGLCYKDRKANDSRISWKGRTTSKSFGDSQ